jgi:bacterioferritin
MKGDADVLDALNGLLTAELTAINQYFIHHKMCANWGFAKLSARKRKESIEQMKHADRVIERILLLEGIPNMQRLYPIKVGENPIEQHELDLALELETVARLNKAIELSVKNLDNGSRELLEHLLVEQEESVDWHEAQLHQVRELGRERYLAEQIHE